MTAYLSGFITSAGITAGILLVYAQLWGATARDYVAIKKSTSTAIIGLSVAYLGALASFGALIITVFSLLKGSTDVPTYALGLFIFSLITVIAQVMQSLISVTLRLKHEQILGPTPFFEELLHHNRIRLSLMFILILLAVVVLAFIIWGIIAVFISGHTS